MLPAELRRRLDLRAGDEMRISEQADGALAAAALYPKTASKGLSLGDRSCLALAQRLGAPAVTAEHAWAELALDIQVQLIRPRTS